MGRFIMAPDKFKSLEADAAHSDKIKSFKPTGEYTGVIETGDVTIDYNYNPSTSTLGFNIGAKHSLAAHMASDNIIEQHITKVLFTLESAPDPVAKVEAEPSNNIHAAHVPGTVNTPKGPEIPAAPVNTQISAQGKLPFTIKPTIPASPVPAEHKSEV